MIITVAHLSDQTHECDVVAQWTNRRSESSPSRVLVVSTEDDVRSGVQICQEAMAHGHALTATAVMPSAKAMHTMLPRLRDHYDVIIIDVPGTDSPEARTALSLSDQVVVPVPADLAGAVTDPQSIVDALAEFMMTVSIARHHNAQLTALVSVTSPATPSWITELVSAREGWSVHTDQLHAPAPLASVS